MTEPEKTGKAKKKKSVLFLCTGNAARSQMAEAIANQEYGDAVEAVSAGSRPCGWVHPLAIKAMGEWGADMSRAHSKSAEQFVDKEFDVVVTVCDSAAQDCPLWPGAKRVDHWPIEDPSFGPDDPATRYDRFLETRDELKSRIDKLIPTL